MPAGRTNIIWWRSLEGKTGQCMEDLAMKYNTSQDKYWIQSEFQGAYGPLRDKLTTAVAAGGTALPDMAMIADVMWPVFGRNKVLEPLDPMINGANGVDISDYFGVVTRGQLDNVYYQLPVGVSTPIFYYNEEMIKAAGLSGAPKTWNDFFDTYAPKTTKKDGAKTSTFGFVFLANADWWWQQSYVWMAGADLSDANWNTYLDGPEVIEFLTRFQKLFKEGQAYIPTSADGSTAAYFGSQKAAMMVELTGTIGNLKSLTADKFTPAVAYLPEGAKGRKVPTGGMGLSIIAGRKPEIKAGAWDFIKFTQQPAQIDFVDQITGYLAFTKKSAAFMADFLAKNPRNKVAVDQLAWSRGQSNIQMVPRAVDIYFDAMLQVLQGGKDPKTLMPEVQKKVQAILKEEGLKK